MLLFLSYILDRRVELGSNRKLAACKGINIDNMELFMHKNIYCDVATILTIQLLRENASV